MPSFAQDDYKATGRLTLNLGFRLEFVGAPYEARASPPRELEKSLYERSMASRVRSSASARLRNSHRATL